MMRVTRAGRIGPALVGLLLASAATAQPPASPPQRGPTLPPVTALPAPGTYSNTTGIQLRAANNAAIRYTLDGSEPTAQSPLLQPGQQLFVSGVYDGNHGLTTGYTIRAIATQAGHKDSEPATFAYTVARRDRTVYQSEEVSPGVRMIRDSDNDKMFLTCGTARCALIDTGMGRGALRAYVEGYTHGLPLVVIFTHSHGDHIGQADQFIAGSTEYVGAADRPLTATFLAEHGIAAPVIARNLKPLDDGAHLDLGGRALEIISVPGHTPGSLAVLDPSTGNLFTGDTFGNNSPLPPDVMWMQWVDRQLDVYLANFHAARRMLAGRVKRIFTGHNDHPLEGTAFLDHLERAVQDGLDRGEAALIPSWRPTGGWQLVNGDRFTDPNWFGMNVNRAAFSPGPPVHVARLSDLAVTNARLEPRFDPDVHDYRLVRQGAGPVTIAATPTETKSRGMTLDGKPLRPGQALPVGAAATIAVTAPDGTTTATYRVRTAG